jgi:membrane-associated protein
VQAISDYIFHIAPIVDSLGGWMYLIIFVAAIIESTPVIGTFTPGTLFLVFFGFLISISALSLPLCILVATIGAVTGDGIGYLLGRYGSRFFKEHKGLLRLSHIELGRAFFAKHGGKSILIGRFVGVIRPIVPLVAGAIRMSMRRFLPLNILSALLWAGLLITVGYIVGANWQIVETWLSRVSVSLGAVIVVAAFFYIKKYRREHQSAQPSQLV